MTTLEPITYQQQQAFSMPAPPTEGAPPMPMYYAFPQGPDGSIQGPPGANTAAQRVMNPAGPLPMPIVMMVPVLPAASLGGVPQRAQPMWPPGNVSAGWLQGGPPFAKQSSGKKKEMVNDWNPNPTAKEFVPCEIPNGSAMLNGQSTEPNPKQVSSQSKRLGNRKLENSAIKSAEKTDHKSKVNHSTARAETASEASSEQKSVPKDANSDQLVGRTAANGEITEQRLTPQRWSSQQKPADQQQSAPQKWSSDKKWGSDKKWAADKKARGLDKSDSSEAKAKDEAKVEVDVTSTEAFPTLGGGKAKGTPKAAPAPSVASPSKQASESTTSSAKLKDSEIKTQESKDSSEKKEEPVSWAARLRKSQEAKEAAAKEAKEAAAKEAMEAAAKEAAANETVATEAVQKKEEPTKDEVSIQVQPTNLEENELVEPKMEPESPASEMEGKPDKKELAEIPERKNDSESSTRIGTVDIPTLANHAARGLSALSLEWVRPASFTQKKLQAKEPLTEKDLKQLALGQLSPDAAAFVPAAPASNLSASAQSFVPPKGGNMSANAQSFVPPSPNLSANAKSFVPVPIQDKKNVVASPSSAARSATDASTPPFNPNASAFVPSDVDSKSKQQTPAEVKKKLKESQPLCDNRRSPSAEFTQDSEDLENRAHLFSALCLEKGQLVRSNAAGKEASMATLSTPVNSSTESTVLAVAPVVDAAPVLGKTRKKISNQALSRPLPTEVPQPADTADKAKESDEGQEETMALGKANESEKKREETIGGVEKEETKKEEQRVPEFKQAENEEELKQEEARLAGKREMDTKPKEEEDATAKVEEQTTSDGSSSSEEEHPSEPPVSRDASLEEVDDNPERAKREQHRESPKPLQTKPQRLGLLTSGLLSDLTTSMRPGGKLRPQGGSQTRSLQQSDMLRWRFAMVSECPSELSNMSLAEVEMQKPRRDQDNGDPVTDRSMFGTHMKRERSDKADRSDKAPWREPKEDIKLHKSENAYKMQKGASRDLSEEEELSRAVRNCLNKICPENIETIVLQLAQIELKSSIELKQVVSILVNSALANQHYCETYADAVFRLSTKYPAFPAEEEGEKPVDFQRSLVNACQEEFESWPTSSVTEAELELSKEDCELAVSRRKARMLAHMKFVGHLFLRGLLSVRVVAGVVDLLLTGHEGTLPSDFHVECACELLESVGFTLDSTPKGKVVATQCFGTLTELKQTAEKVSKKKAPSTLSKRILFCIQDLLDLRKNGWQKKIFKEQAKTKDEVRKQAEGNQDAVQISTAVAGARPEYITAHQERKANAQALDKSLAMKLLSYFREDGDAELLSREWREAKTPKADGGTGFLVDKGFAEPAKSESVARALSALLDRGAVTTLQLRTSLTPAIQSIEEILMDSPKAVHFYHQIVARLLMGTVWDAQILSVSPKENEELHRQLLLGAAGEAFAKASGDDFRRRITQRILPSLAAAHGCTEKEAEGLLKDCH